MFEEAVFFSEGKKKEESSFFSGNSPRSMDQPQNPKWAKSRPVKVLESMLGRYLFCCCRRFCGPGHSYPMDLLVSGPARLSFVAWAAQFCVEQARGVCLVGSACYRILAVFSFLYLKKIKISNIYVGFEKYQKYPRSPPIGRQALSVIIFFFKFATRSLGKKK